MILRGFLKKEIIQMLRNPIMVFALLFMPVVQSFLLSYSITNEPKNIRIAVDTCPDDYVMTKIYEKALSSGWFKKVDASKKDSFDMIKSGKVDVVLVSPSGGLTKSLGRMDKSAELQVLIDSSNVLKAQSVSGYIKAIVKNVLSEEIKRSNVSNKSEEVTFYTRVLFNPEMNTKMFIVPSIMVMIVAMSILSLVTISIAREKEMGTIETLISAPIKKSHIILGKTLPFIMVAFFNMISITILGLLVFSVPFRGGLDQFLLSFVVFSFAMCSLGIFMSGFCENQQQALLFIMMVLFISMMLSGSMFPVETMPFILRVFANINPLTHYTFLARNIMLKGGNYQYFFLHSAPMFLFGCVFLFFGLKRFKKTL